MIMGKYRQELHDETADIGLHQLTDLLQGSYKSDIQDLLSSAKTKTFLVRFPQTYSMLCLHRKACTKSGIFFLAR
jgi:hypothetical protein